MNDQVFKLFGHQVFVSSNPDDVDPNHHHVDSEVDTSLRLWSVTTTTTATTTTTTTNTLNYNHVCMDHACFQDTAESSKKTSSKRKGVKRRRRGRGRVANEKDENTPEPRAPSPELARIIGPGIVPVFLYRKKLEAHDTLKSQNRLYLNEKDKLKGFMTEDERRAVFIEVLRGIDVIAVDRMEREYDMRLTTWGRGRRKVSVLRKQWFKMVDTNEAKVGQWAHLWGYRKVEDGKFRLAVEFRDEP